MTKAMTKREREDLLTYIDLKVQYVAETVEQRVFPSSRRTVMQSEVRQAREACLEMPPRKRAKKPVKAKPDESLRENPAFRDRD